MERKREAVPAFYNQQCCGLLNDVVALIHGFDGSSVYVVVARKGVRVR